VLLASPASTIVTVTIGAVIVVIAVFVAITIMATVSSILVRATAPLVGMITGAVSEPLLLLLVGESLEGPILDVCCKILQEGSTNRVKVFSDLFMGLSVLLLVRLREGQEDGLCKLVGVRLGELGAEQPTLEESKQGRSSVSSDDGRGGVNR
jgi:hypothetical protein